MSRSTILMLAILLAFGGALSACAPTQTGASENTPNPPRTTPVGAPPTPVPTFTPTPETILTPTPAATSTPTPLPPTATPTTAPPAPTETPRPPQAAATPTRRPPTATFTPAPPTNTPKPSVDFKVIEHRMLTINENKGCAGDHNFFITVVDKNGAPLDGIVVERRYVAHVLVPPTGSKGPGKTEDEAGSGNAYRVLRDTSGRTFTGDWTREMSTIDENIPNSDLIASGYCTSDADCNQRKAENQLCRKHYSYKVVFQRQW